MHRFNVLRKVLKQLCPACSKTLMIIRWRYFGAASRRSAAGSRARASSPSKVGEIGLFQPQWTMGIFGALVSNDRAAVWAEGE